MDRRQFLKFGAASAAVIVTPGLLMPVKKIITPRLMPMEFGRIETFRFIRSESMANFMILPADSNWDLGPNKLWHVIDPTRSVGDYTRDYVATSSFHDDDTVYRALKGKPAA